jgi:hypothetical protein
VCRQTVDSAFGKVLPALLAGMGVSIAVVVELGTANEVFEDEGIRLAPHVDEHGY